MTSLVFFGAGASRPFGIPTMQEMVTEFEDELKKENDDCYEFYSNIKNTLVEKYGKNDVDIESIFSVLSGIVSRTTIKELGHYPYYHIQEFCKLKKIPYSDEYIFDERIGIAELTEKILKEFIKKSCKITLSDSKLAEIYQKSYVPLFSHMEGQEQNYPKHTLVRDWKAYTTNYDLVFENFWNTFESIIDNFEKEKKSNNYFFIDNNLDDHSLSKLHGSLDWTKDAKTEKILKKKESGYNIYDTQGEVMLFPIQQKDLYIHPWFTLFSDLRQGLQAKRIWYVIGYAFNDEFILNIFQEILSNYSDKELIIINPDAEKIKSKFPESLKNQIKVLPIKFGTKFFETQLTDYKKSTKKLMVRIVTNSSEFYINCHNQYIENFVILNSEQVRMDQFDKNVDSSKLNFSNNSLKQNTEIKIELNVRYNFGETIELTISDYTDNVNFGIYCCGVLIASSSDIENYVWEDSYGRDDYAERMEKPLILDKLKLYPELII